MLKEAMRIKFMKTNLILKSAMVLLATATVGVSNVHAQSNTQTNTPKVEHKSVKPELVQTKHLIVSGDTLSQLAVDYGVSVLDIQSNNGIYNPDLIWAGTYLTVGGTGFNTASESFKEKLSAEQEAKSKAEQVKADEINQQNALIEKAKKAEIKANEDARIKAEQEAIAKANADKQAQEQAIAKEHADKVAQEQAKADAIEAEKQEAINKEQADLKAEEAKKAEIKANEAQATPQAEKQTQPKQETQQNTQAGRQVTVQTTAYDGVSLGGVTATGNIIQSTSHKVIAVDPNVIPLGSTVYVPGYGTAMAWDTGGAIQGNIVDLNMSTADAIQWGRQTVTVTVLD